MWHAMPMGAICALLCTFAPGCNGLFDDGDSDAGLFDGGLPGQGERLGRSGTPDGCFEATDRFCAQYNTQPHSALRDPPRGTHAADSRTCTRYYESACGVCGEWDIDRCARVTPEALTDRGQVRPGDVPVIMGEDGTLGISDPCYDAYVSACTGIFESQCRAPTVESCGQLRDPETDRPTPCQIYHQAACNDACLERYPATRGSEWCWQRPPDPIPEHCAAAVEAACVGVDKPAGCLTASDDFCDAYLEAEGDASGLANGANPADYNRRACRQYYGEACGRCPAVDVADCDALSIAQNYLDSAAAQVHDNPAVRGLAVMEPARRAICVESMFGAGGICTDLLRAECANPTPQQCDTVYIFAEGGVGEQGECFYSHLFGCAQQCENQVGGEDAFDEAFCTDVLVNGAAPQNGLPGTGEVPSDLLCRRLVHDQCKTVRDGICRPRFDEPTFEQCINPDLDPFCKPTVDTMCEEERVRVCALVELDLNNCFDDTVDANLQTIWADPLCAAARQTRCDDFFVDVCPQPSAFACGNRDRLHPTCTAALDAQCNDWEATFCAPDIDLTHDGCSSVGGLTETLDGVDATCHPWVLDSCNDINRAVAEAEADAAGDCFGTIVLRDGAGGYDLRGGQRAIADLFDCVPFLPRGLSADQIGWADDPNVLSCDEFIFQRFYNYEYWLRATAPFISEAGLLYDAAYSPDPDHANFAFGTAERINRMDGNATEIERIQHATFRPDQPLASYADFVSEQTLYDVSRVSLEARRRNAHRNVFTEGARDDAFASALAAYAPGGPVGVPGAGDAFRATTEAALDDAADPAHISDDFRRRADYWLQWHGYAGGALRRLQGRTGCADDVDDDCGRSEPDRTYYSDEELAHWHQQRQRFDQLRALWHDTPCTVEISAGAWTSCAVRRRSYLAEARDLLLAARAAGCLEPSYARHRFGGPGFDFRVPTVCDWAPQDFVDDAKTRMEEDKAIVRNICERYGRFEAREFVSVWALTDRVVQSDLADGAARETRQQRYAFNPVATTDDFEASLWLLKRDELLVPFHKRFEFFEGLIAMEEETAEAITAGASARPLWGQARSERKDWGRKSRIAAGYRAGVNWYLFEPPGGELGLQNEALCQTNVSAAARMEALAWIDGEGRSILETFNEVNAREGRARARLRVGGFGVYTWPEDDRGNFEWTYSDDSDNKDKTSEARRSRDFSLWSFAGLNVFMRVGLVATANYVWSQNGVYDLTPADCLNGPLELRAHLDVRPSVRGSGFIEAGFDFLVVEVGVGGELDLLEVALPAQMDVHIDGNDAYHADVSVQTDVAVEYETLSGRLYLRVETFWDEWKKTFLEWSGRTFTTPVPMRSFDTYLGAIYDYCRTAEGAACED